MNESKHIHPDFLHVLGWPAGDRIALMDQPRWIGYPYCATDPVAKLRFQVIHKLRACKTRTLTIDVYSLLSGW